MIINTEELPSYNILEQNQRMNVCTFNNLSTKIHSWIDIELMKLNCGGLQLDCVLGHAVQP